MYAAADALLTHLQTDMGVAPERIVLLGQSTLVGIDRRSNSQKQ